LGFFSAVMKRQDPPQPWMNYVDVANNRGAFMRSNRVHFEIPANQPESLTKFYSEVFGWKFQKAALPGPEYWLCETRAQMVPESMVRS
jgi:hypothetical protein